MNGTRPDGESPPATTGEKAEEHLESQAAPEVAAPASEEAAAVATAAAAPDTDAPAAKAPAKEAPAKEAPAARAPAEEAPAAEAPAKEAPAAKTPAAKAAAADAPTAEAAAADAPTADAPTADAPTAEATAAKDPTDAEADSTAKQARGRPRLKLDELVVGAETRGKVVGLSKFGAFVDVGAVTDGLVHISELSDRRVRNVEDIVTSGDVVDVWIKDVDLKKSRISLSMRKKPARPMEALRPGDVVSGKVTSITKYGAFVDIGAETEGLVHVSEMSSGFVDNPKDIAEPGQTVEVRIKEVDRRRERISLSMVGLSADDGVVSSDAGAPQERQPTVVELALRRALGQEDEDDGDAVTDGASDEGAGDLGAVYARMLAEYREKSE